MIHCVLIEDDPRIADFLSRGLRAENYIVQHSATGGHGALQCRDLDRRMKSGEIDSAVIIVDLMLPDVHGLDLCRSMRRQGIEVPILMLTALAETSDKVAGLRSGADDYLTKPFDFDELLARIEALTRRQGDKLAIAPVKERRVGDLRLLTDSMCIVVDQNTIELSAKEFGVLSILVQNGGTVVSRERILSTVWGLGEDPHTNVIDVYMSKLRKKIGQGPNLPEIRALRGRGYRLALPRKT